MSAWEGDPVWLKGNGEWEDLHPVREPAVRRVRVGGGWVVVVEFLRSPPCCCFVPDSPAITNGESK